MNCKYCEDHLSDYLEDAFDAGEGVALREEMELHFQSCSACSELLEGVRDVMQWGRAFPVAPAPEWLSTRIVANTPIVVRVTVMDWIRSAWKTVSEPRFAMALMTSTLMIGWLGSSAGITTSDLSIVRSPSAIYYGVEGWANRVYGDAVRNYYSSPIVNSIQCQIHSRIEQLRENS
jgi:predicted anti-sigma-YlaC factor YlaD